MSKKERNEKNGDEGAEPREEYSDWKQEYEDGGVEPRESFRRASHIALCMGYDLIDKLRWYDKETMKLSDTEIEKRLPHMIALLDALGTAYDDFSDVDL